MLAAQAALAVVRAQRKLRNARWPSGWPRPIAFGPTSSGGCAGDPPLAIVTETTRALRDADEEARRGCSSA